MLKQGLDDVVVSCVNAVRGSQYRQCHAAGAGAAVGPNIVDYRNEHGPFRSRG